MTLLPVCGSISRLEQKSYRWFSGLAWQITSHRPPAVTLTQSRMSPPVVDRMDRVLRYAGRSEVHGNNLYHRAVHILIFNEAVDVYLQQRSRRKDRHPLLWDSSAAGHVSDGENYDEAAKRELHEELGISV